MPELGTETATAPMQKQLISETAVFEMLRDRRQDLNAAIDACFDPSVLKQVENLTAKPSDTETVAALKVLLRTFDSLEQQFDPERSSYYLANAKPALVKVLAHLYTGDADAAILAQVAYRMYAEFSVLTPVQQTQILQLVQFMSGSSSELYNALYQCMPSAKSAGEGLAKKADLATDAFDVSVDVDVDEDEDFTLQWLSALSAHAKAQAKAKPSAQAKEFAKSTKHLHRLYKAMMQECDTTTDTLAYYSELLRHFNGALSYLLAHRADAAELLQDGGQALHIVASDLVRTTAQLEDSLQLKSGFLFDQLESSLLRYSRFQSVIGNPLVANWVSDLIAEQRQTQSQQVRVELADVSAQRAALIELDAVLQTAKSSALESLGTDDLQIMRTGLAQLPLDVDLREKYVGYIDAELQRRDEQQYADTESAQQGWFAAGFALVARTAEVVGNYSGRTTLGQIAAASAAHMQTLEAREAQLQSQQAFLQGRTVFELELESAMTTPKATLVTADLAQPSAALGNGDIVEPKLAEAETKSWHKSALELLQQYLDPTLLAFFAEGEDALPRNQLLATSTEEPRAATNLKILLNAIWLYEQGRTAAAFAEFNKFDRAGIAEVKTVVALLLQRSSNTAELGQFAVGAARETMALSTVVQQLLNAASVAQGAEDATMTATPAKTELAGTLAEIEGLLADDAKGDDSALGRLQTILAEYQRLFLTGDGSASLTDKLALLQKVFSVYQQDTEFYLALTAEAGQISGQTYDSLQRALKQVVILLQEVVLNVDEAEESCSLRQGVLLTNLQPALDTVWYLAESLGMNVEDLKAQLEGVRQGGRQTRLDVAQQTMFDCAKRNKSLAALLVVLKQHEGVALADLPIDVKQQVQATMPLLQLTPEQRARFDAELAKASSAADSWLAAAREQFAKIAGWTVETELFEVVEAAVSDAGRLSIAASTHYSLVSQRVECQKPVVEDLQQSGILGDDADLRRSFIGDRSNLEFKPQASVKLKPWHLGFWVNLVKKVAKDFVAALKGSRAAEAEQAPTPEFSAPVQQTYLTLGRQLAPAPSGLPVDRSSKSVGATVGSRETVFNESTVKPGRMFPAPRAVPVLDLTATASIAPTPTPTAASAA